MERFSAGKPEELAALWAEYQQERRLADELRAEVEAAMNLTIPAAK
jgi:glycogen debranching enzyme